MLSLSCCGIKNKSQFPDFIDLINEYDIVCLTETKTDDFDSAVIQG